MQAALSLENISKHYFVKSPLDGKKHEFWALKDISFEVEKGLCIGLLGPNGSGKSTLLKIIGHIVNPTSGKVKVHGTVAPLLDLGVGFHNQLTGRENIYVYGALIGVKRKELKSRLSEIVDFSGVGAFLDTKLRGYSNGMKMRLAFSIASTLRPDILLADEIFAVGDDAFRKQSLEKIKELKKEGTTILMVQHDNELISQICEDTISLKNGQLTG